MSVHGFNSMIVGSSYYDGAIKRVGELGSGYSLVLEREPNNPYDSNAIAVKDQEDMKLGHIPRTDAAHLAPVMDEGQDVRAEIIMANAIKVWWGSEEEPEERETEKELEVA